MTQQTFRPFLTFILVLFGIITAQAVLLCYLWQRQVRQLRELDRQKDDLLSIVSHQLGGAITCRSTLGKGTTFVVDLPV